MGYTDEPYVVIRVHTTKMVRHGSNTDLCSLCMWGNVHDMFAHETILPNSTLLVSGSTRIYHACANAWGSNKEINVPDLNAYAYDSTRITMAPHPTPADA